jgi:hypothetical protein
VVHVDWRQLAAAVGPASLLAAGKRGSLFQSMPHQAASITAAASCTQSTDDGHYGGSKLRQSTALRSHRLPGRAGEFPGFS